MNSSASKICVRLKHCLFFSEFSVTGKTRILVCNSTNIISRNKSKLARPSLFGTHSQNENQRHQRKKIIGTIGYLMLGIPIGTFLLGTWQVNRRTWKLNLLSHINTNICAEPIELPENLDELNSKDYYPIKVRGTFLYEREFTIGPRNLIIDGKPANEIKYNSIGVSSQIGYYVITPFKVEGRSLTILVNRGWVPRTLKDSTLRQGGQVGNVVEVTGLLRHSEKRPLFVPHNCPQYDRWYYRDVHDMAKKANTDPIYLEMICNKSVHQLESCIMPIPGQTYINIRNEHLSYIITWYGLSVVTGYMWYSKFIKRLPLF